MYNIEKIDTPILQEPLFTTQLYHETWDTVYFINITELQPDVELLQTYVKSLSDYFKSLDTKCSTHKAIDALKERVLKTRTKYENIRALSTKRTRRGLFNFVGSAAKYLFGTMSASEAEQINTDIDEVYNKTKGIATLIKNQTSLLQSAVSQIQEIHYKTSKDLEQIQQFTGSMADSFNILKANMNILNSLFNMEINLEQLTDMLQLIVTAIAESRNGILSPELANDVISGFLASFCPRRDVPARVVWLLCSFAFGVYVQCVDMRLRFYNAPSDLIILK
ncbi:uncharacterized protein LOC117178632 [Belonocnema kinseyi]|uniref:uncharacterized protein LOC117178632 n=1 Tax=Belonocnema kinseyi TaxID=2817044 RepID=UPI00143D4EE3|nr:uncharacterized protein LOC117178632 [Belonocnema kinseyi]